MGLIYASLQFFLRRGLSPERLNELMVVDWRTGDLQLEAVKGAILVGEICL